MSHLFIGEGKKKQNELFSPELQQNAMFFLCIWGSGNSKVCNDIIKYDKDNTIVKSGWT